MPKPGCSASYHAVACSLPTAVSPPTPLRAGTLEQIERTRDDCDQSPERRRVPRTFWGLRSQELSTPALAHERRVTDFDPDATRSAKGIGCD
jgi:hypothetical protein